MKKNKSKVTSAPVEVVKEDKVSTDLEKNCEKLINLFNKSNIYLHFNDSERKVLLDKYIIYYTSKTAAVQTLEEVFVNMPYYFQIAEANPFIVDAGSEVGIATIFFKIFYPKSKILCFEAHPNAFSLLKKNIKVNKLSNIMAINAALTNNEGTIEFFGEFNSTDLDTRGSSIVKAWGLQRSTSSAIQVKAVKLSKHIKHKVNYLKLNVEGAEQQILEDLAANNKMKFIDNLVIKFHHSKKTQNINNLDVVSELLAKEGIEITNRILKNPAQIFPKITKGWAEKNKVLLYTLSAKRMRNQKQNSKEPKIASELQERFISLRMSFLENEFSMLRKVVDNVPSSIYWKDKDGNYLGHSAYAIHQLHNTNINPGATIKNIVGKSDYDIFTKSVADKYRKNDLSIMESKKDSILEERIVTPEGKELVQLSSKKPLYNEKGKVVGIIGSTIDITEHKRAETLEIEKQIYKKQLQEQEKFRKNANQVVHDIRSPLTSLSIIAESCKHIPEVDRITLKKIAMSIGDIANNLSSRYKPDDPQTHTAGQVVQPMVVSLALSEILSEKKYQYKHSPVKFVYSCEQDANFAFIKVEPANFKRMISNLINNAVEAFEGKACKVNVELKLKAKFVEIIIQDNGKGIPKDILDKIMNNIAVTSGKESGSGIGLAQVRETLQRNQGKLSIDSKVGKGTKITLTFPEVETPDWIAEQIKINKGNTIVILDDDESIHHALEARFKPYKSDIELKHFTSGKEAINFINTAKTKDNIFLLSDFELINQGLNGLQVIEQTSMQQSSVLVTSHYADKEVRDLAIKDEIKILPKQLASEIQIEIVENNKNARRA